MKPKLLAGLLGVLGISFLSALPAQANHTTRYVGTPPFNPGYSSVPGVEATPYGVRIYDNGYYDNYDPYYQPRPTYRRSGCSAVNDYSDYDAVHQLEHQNQQAVYRVQRSLSPGTCRVVYVGGNDNTYVAVDSRNIRWATSTEISNYRRYRY